MTKRSQEGSAQAGPSALLERLSVPLVQRVLLALVVAVLAQTLRVLFPLLYRFAEQIGYVTAAAVIPLLFAAACVVPPVCRLVERRPVPLVTVGGLFAIRLAMQIVGPGLWLATAGVTLGFAALAQMVGATRGGRTAHTPALAAAILAGLLLDVVVRLSFATWDPAWQSGIAPWLACLLLVVPGLGLLLVTQAQRPRPSAFSPPPVAAVTMLGPFLAAQTLIFASPAFAASSARVGLAAGGALVLVGFALAFVGLAVSAVIGRRRALPLRVSLIAVSGMVFTVAAGAATGAHAASGWLAAVVLLGGQLLAGGLLGWTTDSFASRWGLGAHGWIEGVAAGLSSVLFAAVLLPYQIHYQLPLPVSNRVFPAVAALMVGVTATFGVARVGAGRDAPVAVPRFPRAALVGGVASMLALVVPLGLAVTAEPSWGSGHAGRSDATVRLLSYNIHEAVNAQGHLGPEAVAEVVEQQRADIVTLQEVGRGWPLSGTTDVGGWLARRLDMRLIYGPAADNQFGNAILTDLPVSEVRRGRLPKGNGTMVRGYVTATVRTGSANLQVWTTHLQHEDDTTATRVAEIRDLIRAWDGASPAVVTGDFNARPGSVEMRTWFSATRLRDAQGTSGRPPMPTCCWPRVDHRIDWVLGTPNVEFNDVEVVSARASDHLPLAVTVTIPPTDEQRRYSLRVAALSVGLTGGIGSGKSEVARLLASYGAVVIDADQISREVVAPGTEGLREIVGEFGSQVLHPDGSLNREKLGDIVFADPDSRERLGAIVHPRVGERSAQLQRDAPEGAVVVHDVPLLVENHLAARYDVVVVVDVPPDVQVQRLTGYRGMSEEQAGARVAAQATREQRRSVADVVIDNEGPRERLEPQVKALWESLRASHPDTP